MNNQYNLIVIGLLCVSNSVK